MFIDLDPLLKDYLIVLLFCALLVCVFIILKLKSAPMQSPSDGPQVPVLMMHYDSKEESLYLVNDSPYFAKDIAIEELKLPMDYDFKRTVLVKFNNVNHLKSNGRVKLDFQSIDGSNDFKPTEIKNVVSYLPRASFETTLTFSNVENSRYQLTISQAAGQLQVKDVHPLP